jgi:hypothetical protein
MKRGPRCFNAESMGTVNAHSICVEANLNFLVKERGSPSGFLLLQTDHDLLPPQHSARIVYGKSITETVIYRDSWKAISAV